jgi:hypothetical protein
MSFIETRMPMTEKTMNEVLRARIEYRIIELQKGLDSYNGIDHINSLYYVRPQYNAATHDFYRSVPARIEELRNILK